MSDYQMFDLIIKVVTLFVVILKFFSNDDKKK